MKSFERWTIDEVERLLHLREEKHTEPLQQWMKSLPMLTEQERAAIEPYRRSLEENVYFWNEEELKIRFIGPILEQVRFDNHRTKSFFERPLKATVNDIVLNGIVGFMVATGKGTPQQPYFFLQEYKPQRGRAGDPLAQVLAAMVAAQALNSPMQHQTLYGGYVIGRQWFFLVLAENVYSLSKGFEATQEDVFEIVRILKQVKVYIADILNSQSSRTCA